MQSTGLSRVFSNTTVQKHQFFSAQLSKHISLVGYKPRSGPHLPHHTALLISCFADRWWAVGILEIWGWGRALQGRGASPPLVLSVLLCPGSLDTHRAPARALNETQRALERLRLQLGSPGALQGKLRLLEQESKLQELQIQSFESDLAEIRADKQNLEAILHSLPGSCASWQ